MRPGLLTVTSSVAFVPCLWTLIRVICRLTIVTRCDAVVEMPGRAGDRVAGRARSGVERCRGTGRSRSWWGHAEARPDRTGRWSHVAVAVSVAPLALGVVGVAVDELVEEGAGGAAAEGRL